MAGLQLKGVYKVYEGGVRAVSDFNLDIADKEFVVFVGPSGCGKSTTLRMIAGLEEITAGKLYLDGDEVNDVEPKDRNIAMVFQNYALYPHMTVFQNMAFGLKLRKVPKEEIATRVNRAAEILGIEDLLNRKPKALSGGQRQRVALGRAIVREPKVFLLDEPLSNLDAKLRVQMRTEITKLHKRLQTTFIYVTHDQTEAMTMGDRIVVMNKGFIQQADTPATLYEQPANVFVATFLGSPQMNVFPANLSEDGDKIVCSFGNGHSVTLDSQKSRTVCDRKYIGQKVVFGIRSEHVSLAQDGVQAVVDAVEHLGSETIVYTEVSGLDQPVVVKMPCDHSVEVGQNVKLAFDCRQVHLFDEQTQNAITGVPTVNCFPCALQNNKAILNGAELPLAKEQISKLFAHAERDCRLMNVLTDKISTEPTENGLALPATVDFSVRYSDNYAVFVTCPYKKERVAFRSNRAFAEGERITLYVPYSAISFTDEQGVCVSSRFDVSSNEAPCRVETKHGQTTVRVGNNTLKFQDMGVSDGNYTFRLLADKVGFAYAGGYARKNKIKQDAAGQQNALYARSYDEDYLGEGKNAVFVQVDGFDDYVTAILPADFSVYKMPDFPLIVDENSFTLTKAD